MGKLASKLTKGPVLLIPWPPDSVERVPLVRAIEGDGGDLAAAFEQNLGGHGRPSTGSVTILQRPDGREQGNPVAGRHGGNASPH